MDALTFAGAKPEDLFPAERRGGAAVAELARCLADNYFDVTLGYSRTPERFLETYRRMFGEERDLVRNPRVRNVVVVGAGASFAAFGRELFPTAHQAIDVLRSKLGVGGLQEALRLTDGGASGPADRLAEEELLFQQLHGIEDARWDFETQLAILSKFYTPRQIRNALSKIYSRRWYPHFIFEVIAHLLKHRFVDVVINYNFDEVLDQAILEEVRGGDYQSVISDGDCVDLAKLVVDQQLKVPLYIKPHGTISHKSTLRFTKDAYVGMPSDLATFTRKILQGATLETPGEQRDHFRVNLISIGFAFTSVELVETLKEHDRLRVFHINLEGAKNEASLYSNVERIKTPVEQFLIGITPPDETPLTPAAGEERRDTWPSIAHALGEVYRCVTTRFEPPFRPRHVDRHLIVHHLLFSPSQPHAGGSAPVHSGPGKRLPAQDRHYFLARLYVELTLAVVKGGGRIDLGNLIHDRVGIYFREWRAVEPSEFRESSVDEPGDAVSLRTICKRLGLEDREGFAGNIFSAPAAVQDRAQDYARTAPADGAGLLGVESVGFVERPSRLTRQLWSNLVRELKQIDDRDFREHVERISQPGNPIGEFVLGALHGLTDTGVLELAPQFGMDALLLLNRPSRKGVIHTRLGITTRFIEMLENPEWDLMLCVSEHGEVLERIARSRQLTSPGAARDSGIVRRAAVVVADAPDSESLEARLQAAREEGLLVGEPYRLPYWAHNDHMMLALRMSVHRGQFTPLAAISYRRVGLESRVNPLFIEDAEDLELLVRTFFGYVTKAVAYMDPSGGRGVPDVDSGQARTTRALLQQRWWDAMMESRLAAAGTTSATVVHDSADSGLRMIHGGDGEPRTEGETTFATLDLQKVRGIESLQDAQPKRRRKPLPRSGS